MRASKSAKDLPSQKAASAARSAEKVPAGSAASDGAAIVHTQPSAGGGSIVIKGSNDKMGLHIEKAPTHAVPAEPHKTESTDGTVIIKGSNDKMGLHIERKPEPVPPKPRKPAVAPATKPIKGSNDTQGIHVTRRPEAAGPGAPGRSRAGKDD